MPTDDEARRLIDRRIAEHARSGQPFSSADIRPHLDRATQQRNLITPRLQAAKRHGLIERAGSTTTAHKDGKGRIIALWCGVGYGPRSTPDRASLQRKAAQLLANRRVTLLEVTAAGYVSATVRSDTSTHEVTRSTDGAWHCCRPDGDCSHVVAVASVTRWRS
jgi:hypothetical protein